LIEPVADDWLISSLRIGRPFPIFVGTTTYGDARLNLSAYDLQEGGITAIVGKKGTSKSHHSKKVLLGMINHGARCIVFDINDEYSGLSQTLSEEGSNKKILTMEPGRNLRFLLLYIDLNVLAKVRTALGTGDASVFELSRAWHTLSRDSSRPPITFATLLEWLEANTQNRSILGAIERRFAGLERTGLITEDSDLATRIEHELGSIANEVHLFLISGVDLGTLET
jgi:KaiC/GvpD/RAD55 family RecA-like ATPase